MVVWLEGLFRKRGLWGVLPSFDVGMGKCRLVLSFWADAVTADSVSSSNSNAASRRLSKWDGLYVRWVAVNVLW